MPVSSVFAVRTAGGAEAKAVTTAASVLGSAADDSRPVCSYMLSKRDERKAKAKRYEAQVMHRPPKLKGREEMRI